MSLVLAPPIPRRRPLVALVASLAAAAVVGQPAVTALSGLQARIAAWRYSDAPAPAYRLDPGLPIGDPRPVAVIVQVAAGSQAVVAAAIRDLGGTVGVTLPLVDGFSAKLPGTTLTRVANLPGVRAVTADSAIRFNTVSYTDAGVASAYAKSSGATTAWGQGRLGTGVGVAVLDTGISSMNDFSGRIVHGPDLSGEGRTVDTFGHGTVMAGVIGGSGEDSASNVGGAYAGVAPRATLVAVKVAGKSGAADVTKVLQGMHWVASYKDQFNIRVLNLSWGTNSTADPSTDPINYAVEKLWRMGIVVVVSAGNSGPDAGTINKPADDPVVLTVGAYNDKGNTDPTDDNMPSWSSQGPTAAGLTKPDVVAPGRTLIATRSYGSEIEKANPQALVAPSYIKGSGTSQAAAVVSGLTALLLEARPSLTPDQVKYLFRHTALPLSGPGPNKQGMGRVRLGQALTADASAAPAQTFASTGLGSIEASRGGAHTLEDCGQDGSMDEIVGEITWQCQPWNGASWTGASWTGASWTGASWTGASWTGASWTGASWTGASWTGGEWTGASWTGASWTGASWTGASWTGASWTGASWTGASWTGASWTSAAYGDSPDLSDTFNTAFWGNKPRFFQKLAGELSDRPSDRVLEKIQNTALAQTLQTSYAETVDSATYTTTSLNTLVQATVIGEEPVSTTTSTADSPNVTAA